MFTSLVKQLHAHVSFLFSKNSSKEKELSNFSGAFKSMWSCWRGRKVKSIRENYSVEKLSFFMYKTWPRSYTIFYKMRVKDNDENEKSGIEMETAFLHVRTSPQQKQIAPSTIKNGDDMFFIFPFFREQVHFVRVKNVFFHQVKSWSIFVVVYFTGNLLSLQPSKKYQKGKLEK